MTEKQETTDEDEIEVEVVPEKPDDSYPWCTDDDERRRTFVAEIMANSEIDGRILVENMDTLYKWLKDGLLPKKAGSKNG
jgi:hypothetical protein